MKSNNKLYVFFHKLWNGFFDNKITTSAGSLTASTLLALVPFLMVLLSVFTAFPGFKEKSLDVKNFVIHNLAPDSGAIISEYLDTFIANTGKISGIGTISLFSVALLLMFSIDNTLNSIWKDTKPRKIFSSLTIYWTILTLGPILSVVAVGVSSSIFSNNFNFVPNQYVEYGLTYMMPFCFTWFIFTLIYTVVPNTSVNVKHAAIGALIAALFFTIGKSIFSWYLVTFPSYQVIYGTLAMLPILIVWINLSWNVVLIGALLTSILKDISMQNNQ